MYSAEGLINELKGKRQRKLHDIKNQHPATAEQRRPKSRSRQDKDTAGTAPSIQLTAGARGKYRTQQPPPNLNFQIGTHSVQPPLTIPPLMEKPILQPTPLNNPGNQTTANYSGSTAQPQAILFTQPPPQ